MPSSTLMMNDDICRYTKRLCMYKLRVEKGGGLVAGTDPGVKACDSCAAAEFWSLGPGGVLYVFALRPAYLRTLTMILESARFYSECGFKVLVLMFFF